MMLVVITNIIFIIKNKAHRFSESISGAMQLSSPQGVLKGATISTAILKSLNFKCLRPLDSKETYSLMHSYIFKILITIKYQYVKGSKSICKKLNNTFKRFSQLASVSQVGQSTFVCQSRAVTNPRQTLYFPIPIADILCFCT